MSDAQVPSETFDVGEIAIYCRPGSPHFGVEVTILSGLRMSRQTDQRTGEVTFEPGYKIDGPFGPLVNGRPWGCPPQWLKKKRPPRKDRDVVRWADCPWQPEVLHV